MKLHAFMPATLLKRDSNIGVFLWTLGKTSACIYVCIYFNYSLKNMPLPTKDTHRKNLIHKLESFIKRIRWKVFCFENKSKSTNEITSSFGFKSVKTPPKNDQLNQFESDLYDKVQNIEFKK